MRRAWVHRDADAPGRVGAVGPQDDRGGRRVVLSGRRTVSDAVREEVRGFRQLWLVNCNLIIRWTGTSLQLEAFDKWEPISLWGGFQVGAEDFAWLTQNK